VEEKDNGKLYDLNLYWENGIHKDDFAATEYNRQGQMKKPKELTELGTGRSQFVRAGVQRVQLFVHGYRECNTPVQVKGGSLAQLRGVSPLSTGYIT